jgi:hypothetical protein
VSLTWAPLGFNGVLGGALPHNGEFVEAETRINSPVAAGIAALRSRHRFFFGR